MAFIDWLSIHQEHPKHEIYGDQMVFRVDLKTGEQVSGSPSESDHEGSYSTTLKIRSNGTRVSVRGNPSKFNRVDNVFGINSLSACVAIFNKVLSDLGLPLFTRCSELNHYQSTESSKSSAVSNGAVITRIDITSNYSVGQGNVDQYLKALSTQWIGHGQRPHIYANGQTVEWGRQQTNKKGSSYIYYKVYSKHHELKNNTTKKLSLNDTESLYLKQLIDWTEQQGIARAEVSLKRLWLKRHGFSYFGLFKEQDIFNQLKPFEVMMKRLEVTPMNIKTVSQKLLDEGICNSPQSANSTDRIYQQWLHGEYFDFNKRSLQTHRARLRCIGIDIALPCDLTRSPILFESKKTIKVKQTQIPSWYIRPVNYLQLVS